MTTSQLRRIYSMRQTGWSNEVPIVVFALPNQHPVHKLFAKDRLHIFPYQLDRIWNKLTFSGLGSGPRIVNTQAELLRMVAMTPGAVGYIDNVDKDTHVNVIKITK